MPVHVANALSLTGQREPRVCALNTAGGDDPRWTLAMYDRLAGHPIRVSHLALFPMPNVRDPEDLLLSQDLIFVGGGSVANMVAVWRVHGLDVILRKAWQAGIVLAGVERRRDLLVRGGDHGFVRARAAGLYRRARAAARQLLPALQLRARPAAAVPPADRGRHPARRHRVRRRGGSALHRRHADRADRRPSDLGRLPGHHLRHRRHRNPAAHALPGVGRLPNGMNPGFTWLEGGGTRGFTWLRRCGFGVLRHGGGGGSPPWGRGEVLAVG